MPSNNLYDMIAFKSPCKDRVLCRYNYSENKEDHWIEPGKIYTYPRLVADLFMDNIVDHYMNEHEGERGMNINNKVMRDKIWASMLVSEQKSQMTGVQTLEQIALNEAKKINTPDIAPVEAVSLDGGDAEQFDGLQDAPAEAEKVTPPTPTRDELLSFAVNELKMATDENLLKIFTKTPEEIAVELQYYEHKSAA